MVVQVVEFLTPLRETQTELSASCSFPGPALASLDISRMNNLDAGLTSFCCLLIMDEYIFKKTKTLDENTTNLDKYDCTEPMLLDNAK